RTVAPSGTVRSWPTRRILPSRISTVPPRITSCVIVYTSPPTSAITLALSAWTSFLGDSVWALPFSGSSENEGNTSKMERREATTRPGSRGLVFIDGPPFDEHLAQLAVRVERVARKDQQVGRLLRLQGT